MLHMVFPTSYSLTLTNGHCHAMSSCDCRRIRDSGEIFYMFSITFRCLLCLFKMGGQLGVLHAGFLWR